MRLKFNNSLLFAFHLVGNDEHEIAWIAPKTFAASCYLVGVSVLLLVFFYKSVSQYQPVLYYDMTGFVLAAPDIADNKTPFQPLPLCLSVRFYAPIVCFFFF